MIEALPVLSYFFHLSPSDIWDLTMAEFDSYMKGLAAIEEAHKSGG